MNGRYTNERNIQMVIALMKAHNIHKVVASPGTTNITFVASIQDDPFFEIYSSVDERSAAYIACGLSEESGEAVALTCTGATASRNYLSGLTEAYYRKLPILAITSTQHVGRIGQNIAQVIDRTEIQNDVAKLSVQIPAIHDAEDEWAYNVMLNKAMLELTHNGGGPVHINLTTTYSKTYDVEKLPEERVIRRYCMGDTLPEIPSGKVGIIVGAHKKWTNAQIDALEAFCAVYGAVVFCDHTSNYLGKYAVHPSLVCSQKQYNSPCKQLDLLIDIGDITGAAMAMHPKTVWRVNPDGEVRDTYRKLSNVFQMEESAFFTVYTAKTSAKRDESYLNAWKVECKKIAEKIPELPLSNAWVAKTTSALLPKDAVLHFGILNSLRSWNFFEIGTPYTAFSNTGGFGIDGCVSSLVGGALADPKHLHFGFVGDLAMFYDLNSLGNRHVTTTIRLLVVNNGRGQEFRNYNNPAAAFGEQSDGYIAAAGHYGKQSHELLKHYAEDLGFTYLAASNKEEFLQNVKVFTDARMTDKPILFEVFTDTEDENAALKAMHTIESDATGTAKKLAKEVLGDKGFQALKNLIKK